MVRITEKQKNSAKWFILLSSVGTTYSADSSTVPNRCAMVQLPPRLWYLSDREIWKPIKDEIRGLACIPEKGYDVEICFRHGNMYALCEFKHNDDTRKVFSMYFEGFCLRSLANSAG